MILDYLSRNFKFADVLNDNSEDDDLWEKPAVNASRDDEIVAYADYDLVGRINYEENVNLWIVNKQEINGNDYEKI